MTPLNILYIFPYEKYIFISKPIWKNVLGENSQKQCHVSNESSYRILILSLSLYAFLILCVPYTYGYRYFQLQLFKTTH